MATSWTGFAPRVAPATWSGSRLSRLKRAAPLLNPIREAEEALASFGDLPVLGAGMAQGLREALDELRVAREEAERARVEEERLAQDLAEHRG